MLANFPSGSPLHHLQGLAKSLALPGDHKPVRLPSFPACERTALMAFNAPVTLPLQASGSTTIMLARQAAYPVWATQDLGSVATVCYQATWHYPPVTSSTLASDNNFGNQPTLINWSASGAVPASFGGIVKAKVGITGAVSGVPGGFTPLGVDEGTGTAPWIFVPAGSKVYPIVYTTVANPIATTWSVGYDVWSAPGECITDQVGSASIAAGKLSGTAGTLSLTQASWIRPGNLTAVQNTAGAMSSDAGVIMFVCCSNGTATSMAVSATDVGTITVSAPVANYALFPLVTPSEFNNSALPWFSTRVTASAVLGTNVTQILSKGGTVLGGRVSPSVINPFTVTSSYISTLHPAEKAFLPLETGIYSFCAPSTDLANFWDYTLNTAPGVQSCPVYRLDNDAMLNIMFLNATSTAEILAVTASWHIEFRTSSALFQVGLSGITLETFHQAQLALVAAGFFYDNPDHRAILSKIISAVKTVAPHLVQAAAIVHPTLGKVARASVAAYNAYNTAKAILPKSGPSKMPTTTAAKSGIIVTKKPVKVAKKKK